MWKKLRQKLELPESYISITLGFLVILVGGILTYNFFVKGNVQKTQEEQKKAEQEQATAFNLPTSYTVASGDTLWGIAEKHYKSGYNWVTLAEANNLTSPDKIETGQKLSIPEAEVINPPENVMSAQAPPKEYTVAKNDTLWKIAEREYGTGYAWTRIAQTNKLSNPDLIHPGNVLNLPR